MSAVHVHRGPTPTITQYAHCPVCEMGTWFVGLTQDWYNTVWTCTRCGDSFDVDEGRYPRPFMRGWRRQSQRKAARHWWDATLHRVNRSSTCPNCRCTPPDTEQPRCGICGHTGCNGCIRNGLCQLCHDIEQERWT